MDFSHYSVMFSECMEALNIRPGGIYADCTAGGGGHSYGIAERLTEGGHLYSLDRDTDAIAAAGARLSPFAERVTLIHSNFADVRSALAGQGVHRLDGALIDLGVSSYQLDNAERGFSYMQDAPLDMRMDRSESFTAFDVVNGYEEAELKRVLYDYGEERFTPQIVRAIINARNEAPIKTTGELSEIIKGAIPERFRERGHHPAKKSFQAIRIEVNGELKIIPPTVDELVSLLAPGGRLTVITFHSLEDRAVKECFAFHAKGCTCPPDFPVCVCGKKPSVKIITKKPIEPSKAELEENPRSRSAKVRVLEKL